LGSEHGVDLSVSKGEIFDLDAAEALLNRVAQRWGMGSEDGVDARLQPRIHGLPAIGRHIGHLGGVS
jgi:hypothetical protein